MEIPTVVNNNPRNAAVVQGKEGTNAASEATSTARAAQSSDSQQKKEDVQKSINDRIELTRDQAEELAKQIESQINIERRSLSFKLNDNIGKTVVSVIDVKTDEVIRQIPSEDLVRLAEQVERLRAEREQGASDKDFSGVFLEERA